MPGANGDTMRKVMAVSDPVDLVRRAAELDAVFRALQIRCLRVDKEGRIVKLLAGSPDEMLVPPDSAVGKLPSDLLAADVAESVNRAFREMQETHRPAVVEYTAQTARGLEYFEAQFVPFEGGDSISVIRNITSLRRAEEALRQSEERLRASQKMEALGRLAGGVAHDFNNLLTVILGSAALLARNAGAPNPYLDEITRAAERAVSLTAQLLALSRKQVMATKVLDLNQIVSETRSILERLIGENIVLATDLGDVGKVKGDAGQLDQVVLNLVLNARDALPRGGRIVLSTREVVLDEHTARARDGAEPGAYVVLSVRDNGTGMDADVMAHLFEPFFTTKARGKGTGLGLATVYGIVKQSGGHVVVTSEIGKGSTFAIHLPRVGGALEAPRPAPSTSLPRGSETILLVEDEEALRRLLGEILGECGYTVLKARSAEDALRTCEDHHDREAPIHLVLTDVVMPGMSGRELAAQIRTRWPSVGVLLMSGYDDTPVQTSPRALREDVAPVSESEVALLAKPFTAVSLAKRVREVLDARAQGADATAG